MRKLDVLSTFRQMEVSCTCSCAVEHGFDGYVPYGKHLPYWSHLEAHGPNNMEHKRAPEQDVLLVGRWVCSNRW
jgi:hypothetical protein